MVNDRIIYNLLKDVGKMTRFQLPRQEKIQIFQDNVLTKYINNLKLRSGLQDCIRT